MDKEIFGVPYFFKPNEGSLENNEDDPFKIAVINIKGAKEKMAAGNNK